MTISSVKIRDKRVLANVNFRITQHLNCSFMVLYFKIKAEKQCFKSMLLILKKRHDLY